MTLKKKRNNNTFYFCSLHLHFLLYKMSLLYISFDAHVNFEHKTTWIKLAAPLDEFICNMNVCKCVFQRVCLTFIWWLGPAILLFINLLLFLFCFYRSIQKYRSEMEAKTKHKLNLFGIYANEQWDETGFESSILQTKTSTKNKWNPTKPIGY